MYSWQTASSSDVDMKAKSVAVTIPKSSLGCVGAHDTESGTESSALVICRMTVK